MNERLYINDILIKLENSSTQFSRTLQVNDLAMLSNRQTNFTKNIKIPKTPNNIMAMDFLNVVGNSSNKPYQKNNVKYFIDNNCIIYNGWAVINQSTENSYEITVYDGNIDFFKAIENKTITDVDVSELDHIKNLDNVVDSFTSTTKNYKYIITDYNGKNTYTDSGTTTTIDINIDYQIPSAKVSYIWDRIFSFTNFTYSGSVFSGDSFTNLYMTYPKPVPTDEPIVTPISSQASSIGSNTTDWFTFSFYLKCFPEPFDTPEADNSNGYIRIKQNGSFRLKAEGNYYLNSQPNGSVRYYLFSETNVLKAWGVINGQANESVILGCAVNDKLLLDSPLYFDNSYMGSVTTSLDLIIGYETNFNEALIDFQVKDFVNEIMQRFGLTMFKDKYENHIEFLTLDEILQGENQLDWSDKFQGTYNEKYILNNYGQKNFLKYRYNEENQKFNDGFILVNNVNLKDETTIIESKIYSPDDGKGIGFIGDDKRVYKFWNKEIKDDNTVKYKELTGRYYFLRSEDYVGSSMKIGSEKLNVFQTISNFPIANYDRLSFKEIIYDYYLPIESILDNAKVLLVDFYLKPSDIENFDFKKLIYVKQLGSYYLVNKISNFTNGKITRCELIEVDFQKRIDAPEVIPPSGITITSISISGCSVTLEYTTDAESTTPITIYGFPNSFGTIPPPILEPQYYYNGTTYATGYTNTVTFDVMAGNYYQFQLSIAGFPPATIYSNIVSGENFGSCTYVPPPPIATYFIITSLQTISVIGNTRKVRVNYISDRTENEVINLSATASLSFVYPVTQTYYLTPSNGFVEVDLPNKFFDTTIPWSIQLSSQGLTSNSMLS